MFSGLADILRNVPTDNLIYSLFFLVVNNFLVVDNFFVVDKKISKSMAFL